MANATILYWNINNFTGKRIDKDKPETDPDAEYMAAPPGEEHLRMMLDTFNNNVNTGAGGVRQPLDFIVVVEIYARKGMAGEGDVIEGSGLAGCLDLLKELRSIDHHWRLVPPIVTGAMGNREAIAVFYNDARWHFLGPRTSGAPLYYRPSEFPAALPTEQIPPGYPYDNGNRNEYERAGQWEFAETLPPGAMGPAPRVNFPDPGHRRPWLTAFGRRGAPNPHLLVRLMSIHTKPNDLTGGPAYANLATRNLASVYDMTARPPDDANQIDVILGDFNVDNFHAPNFQSGGPFGLLLGHADPPGAPPGPPPVMPPYVALLQPPAGLAPGNNSYYHTLGCRPGEARIWDDLNNRLAGNYPGFEYTSMSVDNVLVRYRGGAVPVANHNLTIVNRVVQTPYVYPQPPPAPPLPGPNPHVGYYSNPSAMVLSIPDILALYPTGGPNINAEFSSPENYKRVYTVSDHFPLLFDI